MRRLNQDKLSIAELTFIALLSVALGLIWSSYNLIYTLLNPLVRMVGLNGLLDGIYLIAGVFFPYIIRKPGSAILAEVIASIAETLIGGGFGLNTLIYGFMQGLACEMVFVIFKYRVWHRGVLLLAASVAGITCYILSYILYEYYRFGWWLNLMHLSSLVISSILFAGLLSKLIADKLARAGVLNNFRIIKDQFRQMKDNNHV